MEENNQKYYSKKEVDELLEKMKRTINYIKIKKGNTKVKS